jgi:hypothetical protein
MSLKLLASNQPAIGSSAALTVMGDQVDQAVYWELVSHDPETGLEGPPMGSLLYEYTKTDGAMSGKNYYFAPSNPAFAGKIDRVKAKIAHA